MPKRLLYSGSYACDCRLRRSARVLVRARYVLEIDAEILWVGAGETLIGAHALAAGFGAFSANVGGATNATIDDGLERMVFLLEKAAPA